MGANRLTLIRELSAVALLDGRFENIQVVNCDPITGEHKSEGGMLSVMFRADDVQTNVPVAIKFFDPDFNGIQTNYRMQLFQRESDLLERLIGNDKCLQLIQKIKQFDLHVTDQITHHSLTLNTYYFVVEWLEDDVNDYFLKQDRFSPIEKLKVFKQILLGVFALHKAGLYHRDLKRDNIRFANHRHSKSVVVTDLGTAAAFDSQPILGPNGYMSPVGNKATAPIEALCGLAGVRELGVYSDIYALGCLLHDMFNIEQHIIRLFSDVGFQKCLGICHAKMMLVSQGNPEQSKLLEEWHLILGLTKHQVTLPDINGNGHTVPAGVRDILNNIIKMLTSLDYRYRVKDASPILRLIDSGLKVLSNDALEKRRIMQRRERRLRKEKRLLQLQARLNDRLRKSISGKA